MIYNITGTIYNINVGRCGESASHDIVIDIKPWLDLWPEGVGLVLLKRPKDKTYYTALNVRQDNVEKTLTWRPDAIDTDQVTKDKPLLIQVVYSNGQTVIARAPVWLGRVEPSLIGTDSYSLAFEAPWVTQILQAANLVYAATANADAWEQAWSWILETIDESYPALPVFFTKIQEIDDRLDGFIEYDPEEKMLILDATE